MTDDLDKQLNGMKRVVDKAIELRNAASESGFDWSLIKKPVPRLQLRWVIVALIAYSLVMLALLLFGPLTGKPAVFIFILGMGCCSWVAITVHCRFENYVATAIAGLFGLLVLLVAAGILSPDEAAKSAKEIFKR